MDITSNHPSVRYKGSPLPKYERLFPRIGSSGNCFTGTFEVVRSQLEMIGQLFSINESVANQSWSFRDKCSFIASCCRRQRHNGLPLEHGFAIIPKLENDEAKKISRNR